MAFVGDSIFKNSFGLTHFPGGDEGTLMQSVTGKILNLPEKTILLSGHTEPTTVGAERKRSWYAPFCDDFGEEDRVEAKYKLSLTPIAIGNVILKTVSSCRPLQHIKAQMTEK